MQLREILVVHHTHTDIGYTHPQPVVWDLHRRFIDDALDLCEATADLDDASRVRWTCEVTAPVLDWLERAPSSQIDRFRALARAGQIGVAGALCNMTPLYDAAQLARSLRPIRELRERLDVPIRMAIQHDVNGVAWPFCGLLRECGVDALLIGINTHFGCTPLHRPLLFRWQGPDGSEILVFNAEHYSSLERWLEPHHRDTDRMQAGLERYLTLLPADYPHDFIVLSATHFDFVDNNPPSPWMAEGVRRWNDEGREPRIRFVTTDQLAARIEADRDRAAVHRGDWPDAWNFGCASSARETRINRRTKLRLRTAEAINALCARPSYRFDEKRRDAWHGVLFWDEHTWGNWSTTWNHASDDVPAQFCHKAQLAWEARSWTGFLLREAFETYCDNPAVAHSADSLLVFNPGPVDRVETIRLPTRLATGDWQHFAGRVHCLEVEPAHLMSDEEREVGPVRVPAYGVRQIALDDLPIVEPAPALEPDGALESPCYRVEYDRDTGRVLRVLDRELDRDIFDRSSEHAFFGYVNESVDPDRHTGNPKYRRRDALFETDFLKLAVHMQSGWKPDWPAQRIGAGDPHRFEVRDGPLGPTFIQHWTAVPGATDLRVEISLPTHRKAIVVDASFHRAESLDPESVYFAIPLALRDWRAHYDTAGQSVELDEEQLQGAMRDYVTAGSWVAVHDAGQCVVLSTPDAPMVQIGDFHFGKRLERAPRDRCLLLPWPMNTYWDTNFPASQPGVQRFRFELASSRAFDVADAFRLASCATPLEWHPVVRAQPPRSETWIDLDNPAVFLADLERDGERADDVVLLLSNPTNEPQTVRIGSSALAFTAARRSSPHGEDGPPVELLDGRIALELPARSLTGVRATSARQRGSVC